MMNIDAAVESPSPSPNSPSRPNFSPQLHFYLAVDRLQFKMETLVDLLGMAGCRPCLPMVVCCSTRDELDAVCSSVSNLSYISISPLYSDLSKAERCLVLDKFRQATCKWNQDAVIQSGNDKETGKEEQKSHMIVSTDACLPLLASGEASFSARVLINYELPTKKETYLRQMATCLATDGIVINTVVGGEVVTLKSIEESCSLVIAEMPINVIKPCTRIIPITDIQKSESKFFGVIDIMAVSTPSLMYPGLPNDGHESLPHQQDSQRQILSEVLQEIKQLYFVVFPMIITGLLMYNKSALSMLFIQRSGKEALTGGSLAIGIANITGYSVMSHISGLTMGMNAISSQIYGAKQWPLICQTLQCTIAIIFSVCIPISLLWLEVEPILIFCCQHPTVSSVASIYLMFSLLYLSFQALINPLKIYPRTRNITLPPSTALYSPSLTH